MTDWTEAQTLRIAQRVLADPTASLDRQAWAADVVAALDMGDVAADARLQAQEQAKAMRSAVACGMGTEAGAEGAMEAA